MREMLTSAGFTNIRIQVKENAADIIKDWIPGSGAEKYITSAYVVALKPVGGLVVRDNVRSNSTGDTRQARLEVQPVPAMASGCCQPGA